MIFSYAQNVYGETRDTVRHCFTALFYAPAIENGLQPREAQSREPSREF